MSTLMKCTYRRKLFPLLAVALVYGACSEVGFQKKKATCADFDDVHGGGSCVVDPTTGNRQFSYDVKSGQVDILFVDDNSGSMYTEQQEMGEKFPNFLDGLANLDFRIGIITTDVSASPGNSTPRASNGNGAFRDGKLLQFPNGSKFISNSTSNLSEQFRETIARPESEVCDANHYQAQYCPSPDERGVYASILAFERQEQNFFRTSAHLALVILSDEDERSQGGALAGYPLEVNDRPQTLVQKFSEIFGSTKTLSVHAVIVKPGDSACKNIQDTTQDRPGPNGSGNVSGFYGTVYAALANPSATLKEQGNIIDGELGSICAANYGAQLGDIGSKIAQNVNQIQLACEPIEDSIEVTFNPAPGTPVTYTVDSENRINFSPAVSAGVQVHLEYECPPEI